MNSSEPKSKKTSPPSKLSGIAYSCILLGLCTVVFALVRMQTQDAQITISTPAPTPIRQAYSSPASNSYGVSSSTPAPKSAPRPGVVLERLLDNGYDIYEEENKANTYYVVFEEAELECTLTFHLENGFVRGFTLKMPAFDRQFEPTGNSAILEKLQEIAFMTYLFEELALEELLPSLLSAASPDNYFSPVQSASWVLAASETNITGSPAQLEYENYQFAAMLDTFGQLTIAVDIS